MISDSVVHEICDLHDCFVLRVAVEKGKVSDFGHFHECDSRSRKVQDVQ